MERFERQVKLKGFGEASQKLLMSASVLVVGCGGLGCPVIMYLAAAGVGKIGIIDGDKVELSNLHRQVYFGISDIGLSKTHVIANMLNQQYKDIEVKEFDFYISNSNALEVIREFDLVLDGSDNFTSRYLVNDACALLNKPLVFASVFRFQGQLSVFHYSLTSQGIKFDYRDLFPVAPVLGEVPDCRESGVLGVLPGVLGVMQANEAIKVICGIGSVLAGKMLYIDLLNNAFSEFELNKNDYIQPKSEYEFKNTNYFFTCGIIDEVEWKKVIKKCEDENDNFVLVDVRELDEIPRYENKKCYEIPLSEMEHKLSFFDDYDEIYLFCKSGIRSAKAYSILKNKFPFKKVFSVSGGLMKLNCII